MDNTSEWFLNFDMYGRMVALTFQGHDRFRTKIGAFTSVFVVTLLLAFGAYRLLDSKDKKLFDAITTHQDGFYKQMSEISQDVVQPLGSEGGLVRPDKMFAFGIGDELIDPSYGSFVVR